MCGSIPLSRAIMRERLKWLGHVLRLKDKKLPNIVLFGQPALAKQNAGRLRFGREDFIKKDLKETGISWEGVKREALNRLGRRKRVRSYVGFRRLGVYLCGELLAVLIVTIKVAGPFWQKYEILYFYQKLIRVYLFFVCFVSPRVMVSNQRA